MYDEGDERIHPCRGCEDYEEPNRCKTNGGCGKSRANADRIRAITDEELVEWKYDYSCSLCPIEDYLRLQQKRIAQLERMKKTASKDEVDQIISKLQRAGILDENGNLATPYNGKDNMMVK